MLVKIRHGIVNVNVVVKVGNLFGSSWLGFNLIGSACRCCQKGCYSSNGR